MPLMAKPKFAELSWGHKLATGRSVRVVKEAVLASVRWFAEERGFKFRGRKFGNEAFVNVAAWYLSSLPRDEQERILRTYLPRIESYLLIPEVSSSEAVPPTEGETEATSKPARRKVTGKIKVDLPDDPPKKGRGKRGNRNSG